MQDDQLYKEYIRLNRKYVYRFFKRIFDFLFSLLLLIMLLIPIVVISIINLATSGYPIFYLQKRVGILGNKFSIIKFRSMYVNQKGNDNTITVNNDNRITPFGRLIRKYKIDEIPQLFNILLGQMSFVGPRPEIEKYVKEYNTSMLITLLVKPGLTCPASLMYKNEETLLSGNVNVDSVYLHEILPQKMALNLEYIRRMSFVYDIIIIIKTAMSVIKNK